MHSVVAHFRAFAHEHDDVPAFHAAYLVATFLTAALFSLGFFGVLILLHMTLDYVKYREVHGFTFRKTFKAMVVESITDIALFFLALDFSIYLSHTYMLTAMSGLIRSELAVAKAIGTILPKMKILENMLALVLNFNEYLHTVHPDLDLPMTRIQHWSFMTAAVCSGMLLFAVVLFHGNFVELFHTIGRELVLHI